MASPQKTERAKTKQKRKIIRDRLWSSKPTSMNRNPHRGILSRNSTEGHMAHIHDKLGTDDTESKQNTYKMNIEGHPMSNFEVRKPLYLVYIFTHSQSEKMTLKQYH